VKFIEEFRDPARAHRLLGEISSVVTRPWAIMEICGGQTHAIVKHGIDQVLPNEIELIHGPGCPVCVTPLAMIDRAIAISLQPGVIFTSFGDMLRVPGSQLDLHGARSQGADVRMVYSPLEAVALASENRDREVVFFAIGFETTAPTTALAMQQAARLRLDNFSLLVSHVLVPPAIELLLASPSNRIQGFLLAGHVCTVTGWSQYKRLARRVAAPMAVTGFEPVDLLSGILSVTKQLEHSTCEVDNQYARVVSADGNQVAQAAINDVFEVSDRDWRGIGRIPGSGLRLRPKYVAFDAELRFPATPVVTEESAICISGQVLQGLRKPVDCPAFGRECTPQTPLGATMVSSEGACAAYYRYARRPGHAPGNRENT
jgi:hydrogenase expression/formation protein HypD